MERFDKDTDHSPKVRADGHGRDKDTARDFTAIRDDYKARPEDRREKQRVNHSPLRRGPENQS